jgi:hypothetical protein
MGVAPHPVQAKARQRTCRRAHATRCARTRMLSSTAEPFGVLLVLLQWPRSRYGCSISFKKTKKMSADWAFLFFSGGLGYISRRRQRRQHPSPASHTAILESLRGPKRGFCVRIVQPGLFHTSLALLFIQISSFPRSRPFQLPDPATRSCVQ